MGFKLKSFFFAAFPLVIPPRIITTVPLHTCCLIRPQTHSCVMSYIRSNQPTNLPTSYIRSSTYTAHRDCAAAAAARTQHQDQDRGPRLVLDKFKVGSPNNLLLPFFLFFCGTISFILLICQSLSLVD